MSFGTTLKVSLHLCQYLNIYFLFLYLLIAAVDMRLEAIYYHIESDGIFSALLHDDISHSLARLHIEVMHRLDGGCILREH